MSDIEQRAKMAGHVGDLAGIALRRGDSAKGRSLLEYARDLLTEDGPEDYFLEALLEADVPRDDADAAVAAILDGKHPPGSLPASVAAYGLNAAKAAMNQAEAMTYRHRCRGAEEAMDHVLDLLGCAPAPTTEPR